MLSFLFVLISTVMYSQSTMGFWHKISDQTNWGKGYPVVVRVYPGTPADKAGLKKFDIITHINGKNLEGISENGFPDYVKENNVLSIRRLGEKMPIELQSSTIDIPENSCTEFADLQNRSQYMASKSALFPKNIWFEKIYLSEPSLENINLNVYSDFEVNFLNYYTFDFEYTDTENPPQEKRLSQIIGNKLENMGLKRDTKNPDILIFLSAYVGKKEQYVPPTQQITTRHNVAWNIWTGLHNRQYIESKQVGDYTRTTYLHSLKVAFLDANRAKKASKTPPIIWQGECDQEFTDKNIEAFTQKVFTEMINLFSNAVKSSKIRKTCLFNQSNAL